MAGVLGGCARHIATAQFAKSGAAITSRAWRATLVPVSSTPTPPAFTVRRRSTTPASARWSLQGHTAVVTGAAPPAPLPPDQPLTPHTRRIICNQVAPRASALPVCRSCCSSAARSVCAIPKMLHITTPLCTPHTHTFAHPYTQVLFVSRTEADVTATAAKLRSDLAITDNRLFFFGLAFVTNTLP